MMDFNTLYAEFQAAPNEARRQVRLGEFLIVNGAPDQALIALDRPDDGVEPWVYHKLTMLAFALEGAGQNERAAKMNRELLRMPKTAAWAAATEAARAAISGKHEMAATYFHFAASVGVLEPHIVYRYGWQVSADELDVGFLLRYLPHWRPHQEVIARAVIDGFSRLSPEGARLAQPDFLLGPAEDALTARQEQLVEALLQSHWDAFEAGDTPLPHVAQGYEPCEKPTAGRKMVALMTKRFKRFGVEGESEVWAGLPKGMADAGLEVHCFDSSRLLDQNQLAAALGELDALMGAVRPDIVFIEGDVNAKLPHFLGQARLQSWRESYNSKICAFLTDVHEHFRHDIENWIEAVDLAVTLPFDGLAISPHIQSGKVFEITFDPGMRAEGKEEVPPPSERTTGFYFSGTANAARKTLVERLAPLFETRHVQMNNITPGKEPVPYDAYRAGLANSLFTVNCGLVNEFEAPRGRTAEAISCGVLALELGGEVASKMYVPFVHFMPVMGMDQAVIFSQFLVKHPHWRDRIAAEGRRFHFAHYAADLFWASICAKLDRVT